MNYELGLRLLSLCALFCFTCCSRRADVRLRHRLEAIEVLTDTRGDSALLLLGALRGEKMSPANHALYELLYGKATVLQHIPYTADSVMRQVADYYDRRGDRARQSAAHYVLANAYLDRGQAERAFYELRRTVLLAPFGDEASSAKCDWFILQSAHSSLARLYETQSSWDEARSEDSLAERIARQRGDTLQAILCRSAMCRMLFLQQDYERCIQESWLFFEHCRDIHRFDEGQPGLVLLTESFLRLHRHRNAAECLAHYEAYLDAHTEQATPRSAAALAFCQGRLCQERGETDAAEAFFRRAGETGSEIHTSATRQHTAASVIRFDRAEPDAQHSRSRLAFWALALILALFAALAGQSIRAARKRKHIQAQEKNARALHSQIKQLATQNEYLETTIAGITQQDRRAEYLASEAVQYFRRHLAQPRPYPLDAHKWQALRDETERCFPTFRHRMHSGRPISDTEYTLCLLTKAGFSVKQINLLMEKEDYASTTRRRLLRKIFAAEGTPADFDRRIQAIV